MKPEIKDAFELIRKELRETEPCFCSAGFLGVAGCPAEALNQGIAELLGESLKRPLQYAWKPKT